MRERFEDDSEYDSWFDDIFSKLVRGREDHEFNHYNSSMGCHIYSKEHYKYELKKRRMVPYDVMEEFAEDWDNRHKRKEYGPLSDKATNIIRSIKHSADRNGNLRLGDKAVNALIDIGAIKRMSPYTPDQIQMQGGYN